MATKVGKAAAATDLEGQLAIVRGLRARALAEVSDAELAALLASKHNAVVQSAAGMAAEGKRGGLAGALAAAFDRFMARGEKTDKGCLAKTAVVQALCRLDYRDSALYLRGVRHAQIEPVFGGSVDTAGELRGRCAVALAECGYPAALLEIGPLLADGDGQCRVGGIRAAVATGSPDAAALLRLKLLTGDAEVVVIAECAAGLLALAPESSEEFLLKFLRSRRGEAAQGVLLALGESRQPVALAILRRAYEDAATAEERKAALEAMALLRVDGAESFLLELVERALHPRAREVIESLGSRREDGRFRDLLAAALERRDDGMLARYCSEVLDRPA